MKMLRTQRVASRNVRKWHAGRKAHSMRQYEWSMSSLRGSNTMITRSFVVSGKNKDLI